MSENFSTDALIFSGTSNLECECIYFMHVHSILTENKNTI